MILIAAYCAALSRRTATTEIVLGTDIANRNRAETESVIGFFVNQLVLRVDFSGNPTVAEMIRRVKETGLDAFAHQDYPFDLLVDQLNPPRVRGGWPLFGVKFVMRNVRMPVVKIEGLTFEALPVERHATTFEFVLTAVEDGESIVLELDYSTELYARRTIRDFIEEYGLVLDIMAGDDSVTLTDLDRRVRKAVFERRERHAAAEDLLRRDSIRTAQRRAVKVVGGDERLGES